MPRRPKYWVIGESKTKITQKYRLGRRIGQPGAYGYAMKATDKKTGHTYAVKVINKTKFQNRPDQLATFKAEFEMMLTLKHPNIIKAHEAFEDASNFYIIMEYCAGGELFDRIQKKRRYSERDAAVIIRQIVLGIKYMHDQNVAHCDVKPDNFLFATQDGNDLKIIDFGMSRFTQRLTYMKKQVGTPFYTAPEVFRERYTYHCDMWSIGVVMFIMLFGFPPFGGTNNNIIRRKIIAGFLPEVRKGFGAYFPITMPVSEEAKDLIRQLLHSDPSLRLTASEALEHKWLRDPSQNDNTALDPSVLDNLSGFQHSSKLKKVVLSALTSALDDNDIRELKNCFLDFDTNQDGKLTKEKLRTCLENADAKTQTRIRDLLDLDLDWSKPVEYRELLMAFLQKKLAAKEERLHNIFSMMDLDGDKKISPDELRATMRPYLEKGADIEQLVSEVDINGDGVIDFEEFTAMFQHKEPEPQKAQEKKGAGEGAEKQAEKKAEKKAEQKKSSEPPMTRVRGHESQAASPTLPEFWASRVAVTFHVKAARGLPNRDLAKPQDPYAVIKIMNPDGEVAQEQKGEVHRRGGTSLAFDEKFTFQLSDLAHPVHVVITLWDKDTFSSDDFISEYSGTVQGLLLRDSDELDWHALYSQDGTQRSGEIQMDCTACEI